MSAVGVDDVKMTTATTATTGEGKEEQASTQAAQAQAVALLIDEMRHEDLPVRLAAFRRLDAIAEALGPRRTREELLPYLGEFVDDDDEVLLVLAEALSRFLPLVGGPEHACALLPPLETFAGMSEVVVRDKAVEAVTSIVAALDTAACEAHVVPMLKQMAQADWFTSRISASSLCPVPYEKLSAGCKAEVRALFAKLCSDEIPMVRRAACQQLGRMVAVVTAQQAKDELEPHVTALSTDDQDSVRLLSAQACVDLLVKLRAAGSDCGGLVQVILGLCGDKSWRVRYMVADKFAEVITAVGDVGVGDDKAIRRLAESFSKLLADQEAEVRTAAAFKIGQVAQALGPGPMTQQLLAPIKTLARDPCNYTRAALGSVVASISSVLEKQDVMDHLLPIFLQLLKDVDPEVRLNIISRIDAINEVIGVELLSQSLLPAIRNLAQDKKWRVRLAIIEHIPHLAEQLGPAFFEHQLADLSMVWLGDSVYTIREAATLNLTKLAEVFGRDWARDNIIPKVTDLGTDKSYLFRMTAMFAIKDMSKVLGPELTTEKLLPVALCLGADPVPNVRFNVAKTLGLIVEHISAEALRGKVGPLLEDLAKDSDRDVQFFAQEALQRLAASA